MKLKPNITSCRSDFPMLQKTMHGKPLIYFDSAATAQKPKIVIDTISDYYQNHYGTVHRAVYELSQYATQQYQNIREKIRAFLHAEKTEEIIFTRGTTESINLVAYSFGKAFIQPGDEIIITEAEHHSNIVPWQILCEDRRALLKVVPIDDRGVLDLKTYCHLLSPKTKIVSICHISNSLGTINPIKEMIFLAHNVGAKVLVDGAQASPHQPINVKDLDADFYVFSGHKTYGPTGIGILYGKKSLLSQMPPYQGGGDMIEKVTLEKTIYNELPLKFEAGTPMIAEVLGLGSAIDYISNIGIKNIQLWEHELLSYATEQLQNIPRLKIIGTAPQKGGIISFIVEGIHHLDLGTFLDIQGIAIRTGHHCAQPVMQRFSISGTNRISFGMYNTKEEIDFFISTLRATINKLK